MVFWNIPLTLTTYVLTGWKANRVTYGGNNFTAKVTTMPMAITSCIRLNQMEAGRF